MEDIARVAQIRFALSLNDEERKTLEEAKVMLCCFVGPIFQVWI